MGQCLKDDAGQKKSENVRAWEAAGKLRQEQAMHSALLRKNFIL